MKKKFAFYIDVVGTCNLKCPSCPIGNISHTSLPKGAMPVNKLNEIAKKAKKEVNPTAFRLYNWTEPLLHPNIGECIEVVKKQGIAVELSSNLNISKKIDEIADARPDTIHVSLSGFEQENYGTTHFKGDIEVVKENMRLLSNAVKRNGSKTRLAVAFHRYLGNHEDERKMALFSQKLNYEFRPAWALLMPIEKTLAYALDGEGAEFLTREDIGVINKLALTLDKAISVSKEVYTKDCDLRAKQFALNSLGDVAVCCAVYQQDPIGNYLNDSFEELQAKKYKHPFCSTCMKNGLHVLSTYGAASKFEKIASDNVKLHYPDANLSPTISVLTPQKIFKEVIGKLNTIRKNF